MKVFNVVRTRLITGPSNEVISVAEIPNPKYPGELNVKLPTGLQCVSYKCKQTL